MKMDEKQILEHIQQLAEERLQKKIGDAFLFPKIPTNTVSKPEAAMVQYPKADEIAQAGEAKIQAEIVAGRVEYDEYGNAFRTIPIQHINGDIEYNRYKMPLTPKESAEIRGVQQREVSVDEFAAALKAREEEDRLRREREEQRSREQYQTNDKWGQF